MLKWISAPAKALVIASLMTQGSVAKDTPKPSHTSAPKASPLPTALIEADQWFKERRDSEKGWKAYRGYQDYFNNNPQDFRGAWRFAMGSYFAGIRLAKKSKEKEEIWKKGQSAGWAAIKLKEDCAPCHFWTAINMALYGNEVGAIKMLFSLNRIRKHLDRSIEIDPTYMFAGAYRLNGLIEQKLPGILGGDDDDALKFFRLAVKTAPEEPLNYLCLARLLWSEFDQKREAIEIAKKGLAVPPPGPERIEAIDALEDLKRFLKDHSLPPES